MAQKKERIEKVEKENVQPPEAEPTPTPEEVQPLSKEQIEAAIAEAEQKGYGKAHAELSRELDRKERQIVKLQGQREQKAPLIQPSGDDRALEIILADKKRKQSELGEIDPMIPQLEAELFTRKQVAEQQRQWAQWGTVVDAKREEIEQKIKEAKLDPEDDQFTDVWESFDIAAKQTGNFDFANKKADRILKSIKPKEVKAETPKGEEEIDEEKIRKYLEKKGMLKSDTGGPAGAGGKLTAEQIAKMSPSERFARRKEIDEIPLGLG